MAPTSTAVPTAEIGYVNPAAGYGIGGAGGWVDDGAEETAACTWPQSNLTFNRMRRNSTVRTVISAATRPVLRPGIFAVDPQGADPAKVLPLAEDLDLPIIGMERPPPLRQRGRFSFLEHARLSLLDQIFGHMPFELLCNDEVLKATGTARLHKLAPRFPRSIATIKVARDGGLDYIVQHRMGYEAARPIPVANLVWYANEREGAAWQGMSPLRAIYSNWLRLDRLLRARAYLMERQSMGIPVGKAAPGANQDDIDAMAAIAQASRAGDQSGVGIPAGAELTFEGVRGTLPDINAAIADERAAMADALMTSWLRLGTSESSGNRALGQVFIDQYTQAVDTLSATRADVLTQHVVEDLWDWNYGSSEPAPAVVARPVDAETDITIEELVRLIEVGAVDPGDPSIQDFVRQRKKLPRRTPPEQGAPPEMSAQELQTRVEAAGSLVRSGFDPTAALELVGLDPIKHLGLLPVTLQSEEAAQAAPNNNPTLAARRDSTGIAAVKLSTWRARVAEALSSSVDSEAIAAAAADGAAPADAVAAGMSTTDTAALAAVLVDMWTESYNAGGERAMDAVGRSTQAGRPVGPRGSVVMASLAGMLARAGEIAAGVLSSLSDRLVGFLRGDDVPDTGDALASALEGLGSDVATAERIAVTETHRAMIAGAVDTWASMGITETRWVRASGDSDADECADLDGTTSTSGWDALPPLHPNCLCEIEPA